MRKMMIGAVAAAAAMSMPTVALAQDSGASLKATVKPAKAGTKKKPKPVSVTFEEKVNKPNTTVEFIDLTLPPTLKMNGKGLGKCTVDDLQFVGPQKCASSKAGPRGSATATLANGAVLKFNVSPFVAGPSKLIFYVATEAGAGIAVQSPITGTITAKGTKLRIRIPQELRQPGGIDASLTGLKQTFTAKKGKNALVSSTGCTKGKYAFSGKLTFTSRIDGAPVPGPVTSKTSSKCSK